jgi:ATP-dependent protease ClpP protease subunit
MDPLKQEKKPIAFKAQVDDDKTLSIDMFDAIGQTMFGDGITAESVKNAMDQAGDFSSITMNVSSPGGDLFQGVSIRNLLKQCGRPVNINVVGMCASAASLVATAGKVTMAPGTCYMLHEAQGMSMGDADTMRKMADTLDTVTSSASALYTEKTGKSKKDILALMKAETRTVSQTVSEERRCRSRTPSTFRYSATFRKSLRIRKRQKRWMANTSLLGISATWGILTTPALGPFLGSSARLKKQRATSGMPWLDLTRMK